MAVQTAYGMTVNLEFGVVGIVDGALDVTLQPLDKIKCVCYNMCSLSRKGQEWL